MTRPVMTQPVTTRPSILVATPCFGGMVSQNYMLSVIRLMSYAKSAAFDVSLTMLGSDALISRARSTLVAAFLDNPQPPICFSSMPISALSRSRLSGCCGLIRTLLGRFIR